MSDQVLPKPTSPRMEWNELLNSERLRAPRQNAVGALENAFEEDYRRIVSSASFRRLQDKTQVFPLDHSDFVRTRLTHSLEVSALARSLGDNVAQELYFLGLAPELTQKEVHEIADLLLCAGLIHDIGNPPFGHYGETTIRDWFARRMGELRFNGRPLSEVLSRRQQLDFLHFEGNAQALRLLSKLHFLVDDKGMNLSLALLGSIVKYPLSSTELEAGSAEPRRHKMGYFLAEEDLFQHLSTRLGMRGRCHPLALILEAADDIAYRTADIEDAFQKNRFTYGELRDALLKNPRISTADEGQRQLYGEQIAGLERLLDEARRQHWHKPEQYAIQNWLVGLRALLMKDCAQSFGLHYERIMTGRLTAGLAQGRLSGLLLDVLGDIATAFVFRSKPIIQMEIAANRIVGGLLDLFVPACLDWDTGRPQSSLEPRLMSIVSDNYLACYERFAEGQDDGTRLYLRLLLVTDYICGMTDHFAKSLYQRLQGQD